MNTPTTSQLSLHLSRSSFSKCERSLVHSRLRRGYSLSLIYREPGAGRWDYNRIIILIVLLKFDCWSWFFGASFVFGIQIIRRILRKIVAGEGDQLGDLSTVAEPEVVEVIKKKVADSISAWWGSYLSKGIFFIYTRDSMRIKGRESRSCNILYNHLCRVYIHWLRLSLLSIYIFLLTDFVHIHNASSVDRS